MRSKEVEEAIERIKLHKNMAQTKNCCFITNIINADILLAYIEELENARSPYFIPKAIIQIKIEEYKMKIQELYKKDLWVEPDYTILKLKYENYIEILKELLEVGEE